MKKRRRPLKTILLSFGAAVIVLAVGCGLFIYLELSKISMPETPEEIAPENKAFMTEKDGDSGKAEPLAEPEDITWPDMSEVKELPDNKKVLNILLIGQDRRPGEKQARSDTIIIASYNKKDGALKLISLMRDMYVPIPGHSDNRINTAYSLGGMTLLDKTIKKNFGVAIDGSIAVNFEGFTKLVDVIGGLQIDLDEAEAAHLNKENGWTLKEGTNHLNGQQALEYARIRKVGNADYARTDRQRTVLIKLFESVMRLNPARKYVMLDKMLPYLSTDMTKVEIVGFAYTVLTNGVKSTESYRIPADGAYRQAKIRKMAVIVPNLAKTRAILEDIIND